MNMLFFFFSWHSVGNDSNIHFAFSRAVNFCSVLTESSFTIVLDRFNPIDRPPVPDGIPGSGPARMLVHPACDCQASAAISDRVQKRGPGAEATGPSELPSGNW